MSTATTHDSSAHDSHGSIFKRIWVPFFILFAITALEFLIALTIKAEPGTTMKWVKNIIFLLLTIMKAYYIIAFFMHLKFERLTLGYSIVLPFILIVYLVVLLMIEGGHVLNYLRVGTY
jgi:cytochrome c oxidase subunit IV